MWRAVAISSFAWLATILPAQSPPAAAPPEATQQRLKSLEESLNFVKHDLTKAIGDVLWFQRLSDIAAVDKVRFTGPAPRVTNNPTAQNAGLELIISAYTFIPKNVDAGAKLPLLVFAHGGIHGEDRKSVV